MPIVSRSRALIENSLLNAVEMLWTSGSIMIAAPAAAPSAKLHWGVIKTGNRHDQASRTDIGIPSLKLGSTNAEASVKRAAFVVPNCGPTRSEEHTSELQSPCNI